LEEKGFHLSLFGLITELLLEGDETLADGLTDGEDLGGGTTTTDADTDVQLDELVGSEEEDGLIDLHAEGGGFQKLKGFSVDTDETLTVSDVGDSGGVLLASEALDLVLFYLI